MLACNTLHISFYNIVVQDVISKSPVTATIDAPCSLHRCQFCEPMPRVKLPTSHGAHMYQWTPVDAVDQCNTAWPNEPQASRCPDVSQSAHQGYADTSSYLHPRVVDTGNPIPRNWCTLQASRSLIDWLGMYMYVHAYMESQIWYIHIQSHV